LEIEGRVALVTGAGSGIGRAAALRLAREGARIVAVDRDAGTAAETARMIKEAGGDATPVRADVSADADLHAMFEAAERAYGGLDILYNNAGIATGLPAFPETPEAQWHRTLEVDLWSVIRATQLAVPLMRARGGGVIVNTASMAGLIGFALDPVYAAAKGGVVLFTRSLANLKKHANISVSCVCPGAVDTPIVRAAEDPRVRAIPDRFPFLPPEEIAEAVVALIRDDDAAGKALQVAAETGRVYV
jgi:NAD(P)-dependent dehydrogenase (short-subunit alcohol dehydrogenase family)